MIKFLKKSVTTLLATTMVVSMCNLSCLGNSFAQDKNDLSNSQIKNEMVTSSKTNSSTKMGKTTAVLTVRKGPSTKYSKLGKLSKGTTVKILSTTSSGWYKIKYKGKYGYVLSKYVKLNGSQSSYKKYLGTWYSGKVNYYSKKNYSFEEYILTIKSISNDNIKFNLERISGHSPGSFRGTAAENIKVTSFKNGKVTFTFRDNYTYHNTKKISHGTLILKNNRVYFTSNDGGLLSGSNKKFGRTEIKLPNY